MRAPRITDRRWQKFRKRILLRDGGLCRYRYSGCTTVAVQVDHLVPRQRAPERMFDESNCFSVCHHCHREKERREREGIPVFYAEEPAETRPISRYTHGKTGRDRRGLLLNGDYSRQAATDAGARLCTPNRGLA